MLRTGIVGLPNVGKSTLFNAITSSKNAESANYPFCTINPNVGIVDLPDSRLDFLSKTFETKRRVPATVEFVDIAGLVKGASKGEGLGNQFLAHIRVEKRIEKAARSARVMGKEEQKKSAVVLGALNKIKPLLENGEPARKADLTDDEKAAVYDCHLITMKPMMYVCNVDEDGIQNGSPYVDTVKNIAAEQGADVVVICGKFESDLADMEDEAERLEFLAEIGLKESGLSTLARAAYHLMGLRTFFTDLHDENYESAIQEQESKFIAIVQKVENGRILVEQQTQNRN